MREFLRWGVLSTANIGEKMLAGQPWHRMSTLSPLRAATCVALKRSRRDGE